MSDGDSEAATRNRKEATHATHTCDVCGGAARSHCSKCNTVHYCGRECQLAAWPIHKWVCNSCVRIAKGPADGADDGRGARLVALKGFKEGNELVRERPFARIEHERAIAGSDAEAKRHGEAMWDAHVLTMPPGPERDLLYGLSDAWNDPPTAGGIARTNCVPLGDNNDSEGSGLFALICRANHSCHPNARYIWRHDLQRELLLAVRDIAPGDEVVVTYRTSMEQRLVRQAKLTQQFRFECKCELCASDDVHVDELLQHIGNMDAEIPQVAFANPKQAIRMAIKAIELCEKVGMGSALWTKRLWHDAHQIAAKIGNHADADRYYKKAHALALLCEGGNSPGGVRLKRH